jgi:sugar/nucleoside kinase (ribokinase family)
MSGAPKGAEGTEQVARLGKRNPRETKRTPESPGGETMMAGGIAKDGVAVHFTSPVRQDDAPRQHREAVAKFCGEG